MPFVPSPSKLEHDELREMTLSRTLPAGHVFRSRLFLRLAERRSYREIQERLETTAPTISVGESVFWKPGLRD